MAEKQNVRSESRECGGWAGENAGKARLAYLNAAYELEAPALWREYLALLALALFGSDLEVGVAFVQTPALRTEEPLTVVKRLAEGGGFEMRQCQKHPFNLRKAGNSGALARGVLQAQTAVCLPLAELERSCFIRAEYARLQAILGVDYWDGKAGEYKVLWNYDEGARIDVNDKDRIKAVGAAVEDPYGLSLAALAKLGYLQKRMEMLGTVSYTPFYRMYAGDRSRLTLLAGVWERLLSGGLCTTEEIDRLFQGHERFMDR